MAGRNKLARRLQSLRHYGPGPMDTLGNMSLTDINCMYTKLLIVGLSSQIAVRAETVNVTAHRVGWNT